MDSNEKDVQKALGLTHLYIVTTWIRPGESNTYAQIVEAVSEDNARETAIEYYLKIFCAVRRDQITIIKVQPLYHTSAS